MMWRGASTWTLQQVRAWQCHGCTLLMKITRAPLFVWHFCMCVSRGNMAQLLIRLELLNAPGNLGLQSILPVLQGALPSALPSQLVDYDNTAPTPVP